MSTYLPPDKPGYGVRLGPLSFVTTADTVSETVGDGIETAGAIVVAAERRTRGVKMKLPVRASRDDPRDAGQAGRQLRRQVRALLNNSRWRMQGLYLWWDADPELDGWYVVGGGELSESDPGVAFGEFELDLEDLTIVGRPGTHRPGRRVSIGWRPGGLVPIDSRRISFSTAFQDINRPHEPLWLPGDITDIASTAGRTIDELDVYRADPRDGRVLWTRVPAIDGEVITYQPGPMLTDRRRYLDAEDYGSVRAWDIGGTKFEGATMPTTRTTAADRDPDHPTTGYGWERVTGDLLLPDRHLSVENGRARITWLGSLPHQHLLWEWMDPATNVFIPAGRFAFSGDVHDSHIVELTPERAVIEWRRGPLAMRAILQRGWAGPRIESYDDTGAFAPIFFQLEDDYNGEVAIGPSSWDNVVTIAGTSVERDPKPVHIGLGYATSEFLTEALTDETAPVLGPYVLKLSRPRVMVVQVAASVLQNTGQLSQVTATDTRPTPVLLGRGY